MWKSIIISQQTYFIYCNINASTEEVTLVLYDLKEAWCQTVDFKDVKLKVKALNKRFDFNESNIKEALTSGILKFAAIEEQPHTSASRHESILLKIKYGIKNCVLNYEWSLRRQTLLEFQTDLVQPLLVALFSCLQQVELLKECIRKKDAELHQYRVEGAVLNRKTLATKPFDFESFNKNYEESNKIAIDFKELAQYVLEAKYSNAAKTTNDSIKLQPAKEEGNPNIQNNANKEGLTPKKRKRRREIELMERQLSLRKKGLQYESSQSQTPNSENSQIHEEVKKDVINEKALIEEDSKTKNYIEVSANSTRKNTRSLALKQTSEQAVDLGTDSDSDSTTKTPKSSGGNLRSLRERKLNNFPKNTTVNSQIKSLNIFEFSSDTEECKKSLRDTQVKSPSLLKIKNLKHSPLPPIIDDLSSQLKNIKKELQCLEAMRLADLKKRSCKA